MCQKGFRVDFNKNTCTIQGPSNTHMVIMKEVNKNLFQIPVFLPISQNGDDISNHAYLPNMEGTPKIMSMKMMLENIRIWHNALGHPGATLMKKLTKNGKIPRFRHSDIEEVINLCTSCNMAKARAQPIPLETENRASKMMQHIHCDAVTGLTPTVSGKTGFSLIVDEHSKFIDVKLITHKNEMQDHIMEFVQWMAAYGHKIRQLQTDSTAEFVKDKSFIQWLMDHKIRQEASAPYAKHQNGVVERHIQTIEDRATAILI